ncbi:hypothetical protein AVEN_34047-1 [Araneus ventricosus]|uniref:Uncharacterized protein n=1 Tax=Araneus ventricosus TaxID=182803 RepID=A0A4Y2H0H6_ARAVE|nr:hypothetical protein AVEN_34047-1 [Araneus ventricosus]
MESTLSYFEFRNTFRHRVYREIAENTPLPEEKSNPQLPEKESNLQYPEKESNLQQSYIVEEMQMLLIHQILEIEQKCLNLRSWTRKTRNFKCSILKFHDSKWMNVFTEVKCL